MQTDNKQAIQYQHTTCLQHGLYIHQDGAKEPIFVPDSAFIRLPQILQLIPVKKSTWWQGCKSGRFPAGTKLGHNTTVWKVGEIRELLNQLSK
jgi:hypothetical protein